MGTIFLRDEENSRTSPAKLNLAHPQGSGKSCHPALESLPQECQAAHWLCLEEPGGPDLELETPDYILKKVAYGCGEE